MKKHLLFLALLVTPLFFACNDDDTDSNPSLALKGELPNFGYNEKTITVEVVAKDIDKWYVKSEDKWITLGEPDYQTDTFTLTVGENEDEGSRTGKIELYAKGAETVNITVNQDGTSASPVLELKSEEPSVFDNDGGTITLEVTARNIDKWYVKSDDEWITLGEPNYETDTFTLTVGENEDPDSRSGEIELYAEGAQSVNITINQDGNPGPAFELPVTSLDYMNLKGNVKSLDSHVAIRLRDYIVGMAVGRFGRIEFSEEGMMTDMELTYTGYTSEITDIKYDSKKRPISYQFYDDAYGDDMDVKLTYDENYPYISTQELLHVTFGNMYMGIEPLFWMPPMLKGLSSVSVGNYRGIGDEYTAVFEINEDAANEYGVWLKLYEDDELVDETDHAQLVYYTQNGLPKTTNYPGMMGSWQRNVYEVDADTRMLKQLVNGYFVEETEIEDTWFIGTYSLDRMNSVSSVVFTEYNIESVLEYNSNLDPVKITNFNGDEGVNYEISYVYDEQGNWTEMSIARSSGGTLNYTRNIEYY